MNPNLSHLKLSLSRNILRALFFITIENSISGIIFWWLIYMVLLEPIGMKKDISAHHPILILWITLIHKYIWQMMQSRSNTQIMESLRPLIRSLTTNFKTILTYFLIKSLTSRNKFYLKWKKWPQMLQKVSTLRFLLNSKCITFKYLDWISWSIRNSSHGSSKSIRILALIVSVLCWTGSFLTWWNNH